MRRFKLITTISTLAIFLIVANVSAEEPASKSNQVNWMKYDKGLALAKKEGKKIFVDFTASWCVWCKRMDKNTFTDPQVIKVMSENFINIKVNTESKDVLDIDGYQITESDLAVREYGASSLPTFWFLESDGSKIGKIKGYQEPAQFMEVLTFVTDEKYDKKNEENKPESKNNPSGK